MAFGRKGEDSGAPIDRPSSPPPSSSNAGGLTAFIDQGSAFEGKLSFKDTVRIDGSFNGEIASENTLIVGETGEVNANIKSRSVMISGAVVGDVNASRQLVLHKTARLQGNIETASLVIEAGAIVNGEVSMKAPGAERSGKGGNLTAVEGGQSTDAPKK
ncbi:MAG: polymer-forming cytoskeletal protein [Myxococcales bacterium]|nr:polymer-forming cytoskeletal protein [Myxococcales bacterium]